MKKKDKLELVKIIKEANSYCNVWKISNDCTDNLNRKDRAFQAINEKLCKVLELLKNLK